jgi:hypothetical protein
MGEFRLHQNIVLSESRNCQEKVAAFDVYPKNYAKTPLKMRCESEFQGRHPVRPNTVAT